MYCRHISLNRPDQMKPVTDHRWLQLSSVQFNFFALCNASKYIYKKSSLSKKDLRFQFSREFSASSQRIRKSWKGYWLAKHIRPLFEILTNEAQRFEFRQSHSQSRLCPVLLRLHRTVYSGNHPRDQSI